MCTIKQVYGECSPELCINEKPTSNDCYCVRRNGAFQCPEAVCPRGYERNLTDCRCEKQFFCANGDIVDNEADCPYECEDGSFTDDASTCKEFMHQCRNGDWVKDDSECAENQAPEGICDFYPECDDSSLDRDPLDDCNCKCMLQCAEDEVLIEDECRCNSCDKSIKCERTQKLNRYTCECEQRTPDECNIQCKQGYTLDKVQCACVCDKTCQFGYELMPGTCKCRKASRARGGGRRKPWTDPES